MVVGMSYTGPWMFFVCRSVLIVVGSMANQLRPCGGCGRIFRKRMTERTTTRRVESDADDDDLPDRQPGEEQRPAETRPPEIRWFTIRLWECESCGYRDWYPD